MTLRLGFSLLAALGATPAFAAKPQIQWNTGYGWGHYGYGFGYPVGPVGPVGPVQTSTRVVEIERGTLVVDIWAAASKELVWRGTAAELSVSDDGLG